MQHIHPDSHQTIPSSAEHLRGLLTDADNVIKKLTIASTKGYSDANKLARMVEQVGAEREAFRSDAATAQAAESRAKAGENHLHNLTQSAQDLLQQLQQQAADAESKQQHLQQQKEDTDRTTAQAALVSQQLLQDIKASQEAAAAATAACHGLAAQEKQLLSIRKQLLDDSERAQQVSRNLEVDARVALEGFDSHKRSCQQAKQEAAAECSKLQVLRHDATSLSMPITATCE